MVDALALSTPGTPSRPPDKHNDVLLAVVSGQRSLSRTVASNHKRVVDSVALLSEQIDTLNTCISALKAQVDYVEETVG